MEIKFFFGNLSLVHVVLFTSEHNRTLVYVDHIILYIIPFQGLPKVIVC